MESAYNSELVMHHCYLLTQQSFGLTNQLLCTIAQWLYGRRLQREENDTVQRTTGLCFAFSKPNFKQLPMDCASNTNTRLPQYTTTK